LLIGEELKFFGSTQSAPQYSFRHQIIITASVAFLTWWELKMSSNCCNYATNLNSLILKPTDITHSIGYLTGRSHRFIRDAVSAELVKRGYEISSTFIPVLGYMAVNHPKPVVQRELVDMLDFDRHRVSRIVKDIENHGWIRCRANPESKRENLIEMTEAGFELFKVIGQCAYQVIERAFDGCTEEERAITEKTLKKIINNLSES